MAPSNTVSFVRRAFTDLTQGGGTLDDAESQELLRTLGRRGLTRAVLTAVADQVDEHFDAIEPEVRRRFRELTEGRGGTGRKSQPRLRREDFEAEEIPAYVELKGSVFRYGPRADDVIQGAAGDCYFLSVLSTVADRAPEFVTRAFETVTIAEALARPDVLAKGKRALRKSAKDEPIHLVRLFHDVDGRLEPVWVPVDAFFPVSHAQIVFASARDKKELWVALMEKAFAILEGNWDAIAQGGRENAAIEAITGQRAEELTLAEQDPERLWRRVQRAIDQRKIVTAGTAVPATEDEVAAARLKVRRRKAAARRAALRRGDGPVRTDVARADGIIPTPRCSPPAWTTTACAGSACATPGATPSPVRRPTSRAIPRAATGSTTAASGCATSVSSRSSPT